MGLHDFSVKAAMVWNPGVLRGGTPGSLLLLMPSPSDSLWAMHDLEDLLARAAGVAREFGATRWLLLGRAVLLCALVWLPDGEHPRLGGRRFMPRLTFSRLSPAMPDMGLQTARAARHGSTVRWG